VNQDLLLRNEYLIAENRILRAIFDAAAACGSGASQVWPRLPNGLDAKR